MSVKIEFFGGVPDWKIKKLRVSFKFNILIFSPLPFFGLVLESFFIFYEPLFLLVNVLFSYLCCFSIDKTYINIKKDLQIKNNDL